MEEWTCRFSDDADERVWVRGVDYLSGWQEADAAAAEYNAVIACVATEVDRELMWARPHAGPCGNGRVWLTPDAVRVVARLLAERKDAA